LSASFGAQAVRVAFVSGHLDLTESEFEEHYVPALDRALAAGDSFVIGDARGADLLAQRYLQARSARVTVHHMFTAPRNNAGFPTVGGFTTDDERDRGMTTGSDYDIAWVRPGRTRSGTARNLTRRGPHSGSAAQGSVRAVP
jgi:hypothetical protein